MEELSKAKEKLRTEALKQEPAWLLVQLQLSGQAGIGQGWRRHGKLRKGFAQRGLLHPIQRSKAPKRQGPGRQDLRREFAFREAARITRGVRQSVRRGSRPRGQRAEACGGGGVRRVTFRCRKSRDSTADRARPASSPPLPPQNHPRLSFSLATLACSTTHHSWPGLIFPPGRKVRLPKLRNDSTPRSDGQMK